MIEGIKFVLNLAWMKLKALPFFLFCAFIDWCFSTMIRNCFITLLFLIFFAIAIFCWLVNSGYIIWN